jgi:hypothetical protein
MARQFTSSSWTLSAPRYSIARSMPIRSGLSTGSSGRLLALVHCCMISVWGRWLGTSVAIENPGEGVVVA